MYHHHPSPQVSSPAVTPTIRKTHSPVPKPKAPPHSYVTPEAAKAYEVYRNRHQYDKDGFLLKEPPLEDFRDALDWNATQQEFRVLSLESREPESKAAPRTRSADLGYNPVLPPPPPKRESGLAKGFEMYSLDNDSNANVQDVVIQCANVAGKRALFDKGTSRPKRTHSLDRRSPNRRRYDDPNNRFNALRSQTPPPTSRNLPTRMDLYTVGDRGVSRECPPDVHPEDSLTSLGSGIGAAMSHDILDFQKRFSGVVEGLYSKDIPDKMRKDLVEMLLRSELQDRPADAQQKMVSVAHSIVSSRDSGSWCNIQSDFTDFTQISSTAGQVNRPPPTFSSLNAPYVRVSETFNV